MKVLITAAGSPGFLSFCKSLKENSLGINFEIHACDANPEATGFSFCDNFFVAPYGNSPEYIPRMYQYCFMNDISVIIPCSDGELVPLSKNVDKFKKIGCEVLVSSENSLERTLDKFNLLEECSRDKYLDSICPEYYLCSNFSEITKAYISITSSGKKACIKPVKSHGSRGFRVIEELQSHKDFFSKKASANSITFENLKSILKGKRIPKVLVMEYLEGEEYSVDCFRFFSDFYCVTRRRDKINSGICSSGEAIEKNDLMRFSRILCNKFSLDYNINIQFKYDSNGNAKILEINPRVAGTMELSRGAGINFLELSICKAFSIIPQKKNYEVKWGTKMERIWEELFIGEDSNYILYGNKKLLEK